MTVLPSDFQLDHCYRSARTWVEQAGQILLGYYGRLTKISEKESAGLVTEADHASEKFLLKNITASYPKHGYMGEETSEILNPDSDFLWLVDPLDGTTNFVHSHPFFAVSVGLQFKNQMIMGLVYAPALDLFFGAQLGSPAQCNGEAIQVSQRRHLRDCLFATGFSSQSKKDLPAQIQRLKKVLDQTRGIRRNGSAAIDLCFVARGVFDAYWETQLSPWDTAAGSFIVQQAGGVVQNENRQPFHPEDSLVFACQKQMLEPIGNLIGLSNS